MTTFTGKVVSVAMMPGRTDAMRLVVATEAGERPVLFSMDVDSKISIDGHQHYNGITPGYLFDWLARSPDAVVTVHPDPQLYGLSTLTEFRSAP